MFCISCTVVLLFLTDAADKFIANLLENDLSDIEGFSDDEDADASFIPVPPLQPEVAESSSSEEDEQENADQSNHLPGVQEEKWFRSQRFEPLPAAPPPECESITELVNPINTFYRYVPEHLINRIAMATSQRILASTGKAVMFTGLEMRKFIAINIIMSYLKFPRIKMYWAAKTRVSQIADVMSRNFFFLIRNHLTCCDYSNVTAEEKKNKFWKIAPIIDCVRIACLENPRSECVAIDEQIIPFWGHTSARQYIRGKPNPCGLKNFVCAATDGLPMDFFLYQGKGDSIIDDELNLDIGGKVVIKLTETLSLGTNIYVDRYFTSIPLLDEVHIRGFHVTGTLQNCRVPRSCNLDTDTELKRQGRGSYCQLVRDDGQVAVIKWYDNKPVSITSNLHGGDPKDEVVRYSKKDKAYINVSRPNIIAEYNAKMGGVDFLDRMIAYYRTSARTKKWTVRAMLHFIDFSLAAGWIERKRAEESEGVPKKDRFDLLDFKIDVAHSLLNWTPPSNITPPSLEPTDESGTSNKKRKTTPLPHASLRTTGALHLPEIPQESKLSRCRFPGCSNQKCRFMCVTCKVFLCLNNNRNCFKAFHEL